MRFVQCSVVLAFCAVVAIAFAPVLAQAPEAPKPGPEHARLGYFVGKWTSEGTISESPFGPGGKFKMTDRCEWFEGKFAVVCHSEGKGPNGPMKALGIMGYDPMAGDYTYYGVDNTGMIMSSVPKGTVEGDTWTYHDEPKMGDATIKSRFTMVELSPTSYTFRWEIQGEKGWSTVMEGKATKS